MAKLIIYHNSRCSKSRETLDLIQKSGKTLEVVEYLTHPPTAAELERLLGLLKLEPEQITRKKEAKFTELGLDDKPPKSRKEWIEVLVQNPVLIERPIVTDGKRAVLGRPPENVLSLIDG